MQFSLSHLTYRRVFNCAALTILFLTIACRPLSAHEQVNYIPFLLEDLPSRNEPAHIATKSAEALLSEGYIPIGDIEVLYDKEKCLDDKCTQYAHKDDSASRLLIEAAKKGGDLVILKTQNKLSKKDDYDVGKCIKWEEKTVMVEVPVYKYKKKNGAVTSKVLVGLKDKPEKQSVCVESTPTTIINSSFFRSHGSVWHKNNNYGIKEIDNWQNPQDDSGAPLARVAKKSESSEKYKIGYIDKSGKLIIAPKYSAAHEFSNGLAAVQIDDGGKWGYIDKAGKMVIEPIFENAEPFKEDLALVKLGGHFGYIRADGIFVIMPEFEHAFSFSEGMAAVRIEYKYGFINKSGKIVIDPIYHLADRFSEGLARVRIKDKYGFIDKSGRLIVKPMFFNAKAFSGGLAGVQIRNKYGFIDKSGTFVIEPKFASVESFSEGLAAVYIDRKIGFIDMSGNFVLEPDFVLAGSFANGLAKVVSFGGEKIGYIDKSGKFVFHDADLKPYDLSGFSAGLATVKLKDNKYIILDNTGKRVGAFEADKAYEFTDVAN